MSNTVSTGGSLLVLQAMWQFLARLEEGKPLAVATRVEDRARQKACKNGWAVYRRDKPNRGWLITDAGREALTQYRQQEKGS